MGRLVLEDIGPDPPFTEITIQVAQSRRKPIVARVDGEARFIDPETACEVHSDDDDESVGSLAEFVVDDELDEEEPHPDPDSPDCSDEDLDRLAHEEEQRFLQELKEHQEALLVTGPRLRRPPRRLCEAMVAAVLQADADHLTEEEDVTDATEDESDQDRQEWRRRRAYDTDDDDSDYVPSGAEDASDSE